jgi:hypothetical protein
MPRRRPAESRPLLDEPPAFFVACRTVVSWDGGCEYWRDGYCERMEVLGLMRDVMEVSGDVLLLARKERPSADDVVHEVNARRLADVLVAIPDALLENTLNMVVLRREMERQSRSLRTRGGVSGRRCCGYG